MVETQYGITKAEPSLPVIDLLRVPHKGGDLDVAIFGPDTYRNNLSAMRRAYFHSRQLPNISFRPATTSKSISVAAYEFENMAKPNIFDTGWLQAGYIVIASEGIFVDPPKDTQGNPIIDEQVLKSFLKTENKVNGIYLLENDFGFAPYESFKRGVQDCDTFAQGGLAKVLEHTDQKVAKNLKEMASPKIYRTGVNVWCFDEVKEPVLRVACLVSAGRSIGGGLSVLGYWGDELSVIGRGDDGFAFGVLE